MKLIASLLVAVSLTLGTIAATTAYMPKLTNIDPAKRLTLNAPAGIDADSQPLVPAGELLTEEVLASLGKANIHRVRVKEFSLTRWDFSWLFLVSCVGLVFGAVLIRRSAKRDLEMAMAPVAGAVPSESPEALLRSARDELAALQHDLASMPDETSRMRAILARVADVQQERFDPFVMSRPLIVAKLGMVGYAQLMDRFAAAERQVNRAWSAAADRVLDESEYCLEQAMTPLNEAIARLG